MCNIFINRKEDLILVFNTFLFKKNILNVLFGEINS